MNDLITKVDETVDVVTSFTAGGGPTKLCRPYKMRWRGQEVTFKELAFRHPTTKGQRMIHVFDMSDGEADYRLELDSELLTWRLIEILKS